MGNEIEVTVELRSGVDLDTVRSSLADFIAGEGGVVRMDRPIRQLDGGRHFHLAATQRGTGTLEVNFEPGNDGAAGSVRIVVREHWAGTWAGDASLRMAGHVAKELGAR